MTVIVDTPEYQIVETITPNGSTRQVIPKPGGQLANAQQIATNIANALARLRQIQTQAATFQAQPDYTAATLAAALTALNDLLHKSQTMAAAVSDIAADLIGVARLLSNQYDGTA